MSFRDSGRDDPCVARIQKSIQEGHISHAYLLEGDTFVDKDGFARDMLQAILCPEAPGEGCGRCITCRKIEHGTYEDLYRIQADGLSIRDEEIFQLQEKLKRRPMAGDRNVVVIRDADTMTVRAQNRLLKTLEEPPAGTVLLLLSENRENLLETVRSRCVIYRLDSRLPDWQAEDMKAASDLAQCILDGAGFLELKGRIEKTVRSRDDALHLLDGLERLYRDFLLGKDERGRLRRPEEAFRDIALIEEARRDVLAKGNVQYAIRNLTIKMGGRQ